MLINKNIKRKCTKIISVILDLLIFFAHAYTLFINFADAILITVDQKVEILVFSLIVSLSIPGLILVLLHALEKAEDKNSDLETEMEYLKLENSILIKHINEHS